MTGRNFNYERAATILTEAMYKGDERTAQDWGVHRITISRYRTLLETDDKLLQLVNHKRRLIEGDWSDEAPLALLAAIDYLRNVARSKSAKRATPEMVHAIAGAMKLVSDVLITKRLLDAKLSTRLSEMARLNGPQHGQSAATDSATPIVIESNEYRVTEPAQSDANDNA